MQSNLAAVEPQGGALNIESVLQADWPLPLWLTIVLATLLAAAVGTMYFYERGTARRGVRLLLAGIRFTLIALVLWMWAGWNWLQFRSDKPELLVLLDRSASMETRDMPDNSGVSKEPQTRLSMSLKSLKAIKPRDRERLERSYQVRMMFVDEIAEPTSFDLKTIAEQAPIVAAGAQSRLGDSLSSVIGNQAGRGTAAIVFFSDGINTSGAPLVAAATKRELQVYRSLLLQRGKNWRYRMQDWLTC